MNPELTQQLLDKYPNLFSNQHFGIETPHSNMRNRSTYFGNNP